MALVNALGLLMLGAAGALTHPERGLVGWLRRRPDRLSLLDKVLLSVDPADQEST